MIYNKLKINRGVSDYSENKKGINMSSENIV